MFQKISHLNAPASRGQALIEYLVIVSIVTIGSIGVVSIISQNLNSRLSSIAAALTGKEKTYVIESINRSHISKKNLGNFMKGAGQ